MSELTGKGLASFASSKLGTPYVYGAKGADGKFTQSRLNWLAKNYPGTFTTSYIKKAKKFIGQVCCDCSGLISWYTGKVYGSSQLYSKASKRIPISQIKTMPIGTVLWKQGHVGVYIGMVDGVPMCVEEKGINYGCVKTKVSATKWQYGLLFSWITYDEVNIGVASTSKAKNPYSVPARTLKYGMVGNDVKWLQYELIEAGYTKVKVGLQTKTLTIDGDFGTITKTALGLFQQSAKLEKDYLCGKLTRAALIED